MTMMRITMMLMKMMILRKKRIEAIEKRSSIIRHKWLDRETKLLLTLYKEHDDDFSAGKIIHRNFWKKIINGFDEKGYHYTINQCITKMDTYIGSNISVPELINQDRPRTSKRHISALEKKKLSIWTTVWRKNA